MKRAYYSNSVENFLASNKEEIIGILASSNQFKLEQTQRDAWREEVNILQNTLQGMQGSIYFEFSIPRMGKRIDVVIIIKHVIFILEFKVGEKDFHSDATEQVFDYALDLKNFHETSHKEYIAPILMATKAKNNVSEISTNSYHDRILFPIKCNSVELRNVLASVIGFTDGGIIDIPKWEKGRYYPTPTIVEAAKALYSGHSVADISRSDAGATNLHITSASVSKIIEDSKNHSNKSICFVTGVPGAGKTLVGLDIATKHSDPNKELYSVFLSGNGPLVKILCEALARDKVRIGKGQGTKVTKKEALSEVKQFIQNVHHFRDECISEEGPPIEHVALFDEAQRAWDLEQTSKFMQTKKSQPNFNIAESEFLISCLDRHRDWAVVVCLVGGGQEINTGEAGIGEWIEAINRAFPNWHVYISPMLHDEEYGSGIVLEKLKNRPNVFLKDELHLNTSMRSFRAENVSKFVKNILDLNIDEAKKLLEKINHNYPIVITRDLTKAKYWLKEHARGSERYGIVVSSQAERLKPYAIDVRSPMDPVHWFLDSKEDVRSSYYLEDVATEFDVQGLELDWVCVTWDADFRYGSDGWNHFSFKGNKWQNIRQAERKSYLKNAYRVLLTRARQGMVIVVPIGNENDPTRNPQFYDNTFNYLKEIGIIEI